MWSIAIGPIDSYARCLGRGGSMSELSPAEPSIATAGAARTAELARGGTEPDAEHRRAIDRERKRRASAKAPPAESQDASPTPELRSWRLRARNGNEPAVRSSVK